MSHNFSIRIGGIKIENFDGVQLMRSMEHIAYSLRFTISGVHGVKTGAYIQVLWQDKKSDPIFTGYIDEVRIQLSGGTSAQARVSVHARSSVCDIVDSSINETYNADTLANIITSVAKDFNIKTTITHGMGQEYIDREVNIQNTSPYAVLNRLAREYGYYLVGNGWGVLELAKPRTNDTYSITEQDCMRIDYSVNEKQRFHSYSVQSGSAHSVETETKPIIYTDTHIRATRHITLSTNTGTDLQKYAQHEAHARAGFAQQLTLTLPQWQPQNGTTHWYENCMLAVDFQTLYIQGRFFVYEVCLNISKTMGSYATIQACLEGAYSGENMKLPNSPTNNTTQNKPFKTYTTHYF